MTPAALPYVLLLGLLFGSTLLVSRFSLGQFSPTTYTWLRLALSSAAFASVYLIGALRGRGRRLPAGRELWRDGIVLGIFGTAVPTTAYVASLQYQSAGMTALLLTTAPAMTVLMAQFLLPDERLTVRKGVGILLALAGAALVVLRGESGLAGVAGSPIGYGIVIGALVIDCFMAVYTRKHCREYDTIDLSGVRMLVATLVVAPLSLALVGFDVSAVTATGITALIYAAAAGTFGGLILFLWVNQRFGATAASLTSYVLPVVAATGGVLFLGEAITPVMLAGMALIIGGIATLNRREPVVLEIET
ncbi:MAG: DMT family transporter [Candidatus Promineofilum sp.]|nr:DMT family transporter [Promineifilum sp.]